MQPVVPLDASVLQQHVLPLDVSVLQQPVLPLDVSVLQQPVLSLDVSVLQKPLALLENLDMSVWQQPMLPLDVSVLQQPGGFCLQQLVLHLDVSVYLSLCWIWTCLSKRAFVLHRDVCSQEPVLHLYVRVLCRAACNVPGGVDLQQLVLYLDVSVYKSLCLYCIWMCLSLYKCFCAALGYVCLQEPVLHLHVSVYESFCCTWTCLHARAHAAPGDVWSAKDFSVCFVQKKKLHFSISQDGSVIPWGRILERNWDKEYSSLLHL